MSWQIAALLALLAGQAAAQSQASSFEPVGNPADLQTYVATDRDRYLLGATVTITSRTCNETGAEIRFWEGCRFEVFSVLDGSGAVVAASDHSNTGCGGEVTPITWPADHCEIERTVWPQTGGALFNRTVEPGPQLPPGDYQIRWQRSQQIDRIASTPYFGLVTAMPVPAWSVPGLLVAGLLIVSTGVRRLRT